MGDLDCVLIGYNDVDFDVFAAKQKRMAKQSGGYHEIKTNSLIHEGKRLTYMAFLNEVIARATGKDPELNVFEAPALGACCLRNHLQKQGFEAEVVNFFNYDKAKLKRLLARNPRAVAITTTFYIDSAPVAEIVKFVRQHNPAVKIIAGGPHILNLASDLDEATLGYVFKSIGADIYIIDSQGEQTLARVAAKLRETDPDLSAIPNLYYADATDRLRRTERKAEQNDLDENSVDWSRFDNDLITPIAYLRTARSCPFKCTFCNYPTMAGAHTLGSVEALERELRQLHAAGTTDVVFIDDTFNVPLPRFKNILRMMIANGFGFRWVSFFRCSNADEEAIALMRESGCQGVLLGIESGDQRQLEYMNKAAKLPRYEWGIQQLNQHGIASFVSLICGFPGETRESVMNTIQFIEKTKPTFFNVQLYFHDLRAPIHRQAERFGIHGAGYNWRHDTMTWQEAAAWACYMLRNIRNATPLGLLGFSLWGVSYLLSQGVSMDQIVRFGELTRPMLYDGLDDRVGEYSREMSELTALFRNFDHEARGARRPGRDLAAAG